MFKMCFASCLLLMACNAAQLSSVAPVNAETSACGSESELLAFKTDPESGRGCCSWHGGVCGCAGGRAKCCDGSLSPSCGCGF
jgi:hypothetical protein